MKYARGTTLQCLPYTIHKVTAHLVRGTFITIAALLYRATPMPFNCTVFLHKAPRTSIIINVHFIYDCAGLT